MMTRALSSFVTVALLVGCGGSQPPIGAPSAIAKSPELDYLHHKTFHLTRSKQVFTVPAHVSEIAVDVLGAAGGGPYPSPRGGRVSAVIPVRPGEELFIYVGGAGLQGGFNGGGIGGEGSSDCLYCPGFIGGGASDIRRNGNSLRDRIIVAGGGGGDGASDITSGGANGGDGGTITGESGFMESYGAGGGGGGSQRRGGHRGRPGCGESECGGRGRSGLVGEGGAGGSWPSGYYGGAGGGGGGGGYYGGGGGGGDGGGASSGNRAAAGGGGGGGSSYAEPSATNVQMWRGWKNAGDNALVIFRW